MLRRLASILAAAVLLSSGGVVLAATSAHADTAGCVTKAEYRRADKGTKIRRAHRIFDTRGLFIDGGAGGFARGYRFCNRTQRATGTRRFTIIYAARARSIRVNTRYCGPTYDRRRNCF